ncbi:glycoside hydrolase family 3 C-terminal domain-containing protein [bacterium]|nr:glycoside hydrolase family 3 C-terminal domain-containing protein [bacterium]
MYPVRRTAQVALACVVALALAMNTVPARAADSIYHRGWIDFNKNGKKDIFEDPTRTIDERVEDLLAQMNVNEKTMQMVTLYGYQRVLKDALPTPEWKSEIWKDGVCNIDEEHNGWKPTPYDRPPSKHAEVINTVQRWFVEQTRLGIPVDFTNEGIHGIRQTGATDFPTPPAMGASFDRELVRDIARATAREARATGYTNIYAPILDLARDPRWGRCEECYSEDAYLAGELGVEMTLGLQENLGAGHGVVSTPKHFAVYSVPEGGREGLSRINPQVTWREVQMTYNVPFKAAFMRGKALGVMASYNDYDAIPVAASKMFLTDILRQQWGFKGYVVSDSDAVEYIENKHHVAATYKEAVRMSVQAGLNVRTTFTPPSDFVTPLRELIAEGSLSMDTIDSRVRDVLRVKFMIGLFDEPYVKNPKAADKLFNSKESLALARRGIEESVVLLKNENNPVGGPGQGEKILPLDRKKIKSILVAGPLAGETKDLIGGYGPMNETVTSMVDGIKAKVGKGIEVHYAKGCDLVDKRFPESELVREPLSEEEQKGIDEAVVLAEKSDVCILVLGENEQYVGENASRTSIELMGRQNDLARAIYETGVPTIVILMNGRVLTINYIKEKMPAILEAWFPGPQGASVLADILFGDVNPSGKLPVTFPKTLGQMPYNFPYHPGSRAEQRRGVNGYLFPFGHGLSYTEFQYSNLRISPAQQKPQGKVKASVAVTNIGSREGDEVVQLYVRDVVGSVVTNVKDLRGFQRVHLKPGESKTVEFWLGPEELQLYDRNNQWTVEPGQFKVMVGSSEDTKLEQTLEIVP